MSDIKITDARALPGDSAFLIDDGVTSVMLDSGFAFTGFQVADRIKAALNGRSLDYIFLTHSHYDHALGSAYALRYWPDAKVVAGEYATKIFAKPSAKAVMRDLDRKFADQCGVGEYEDLVDDLRVDIPVADGDVISAGNMTFKAVNLPGHTKCSVGYYMPEEKLLISTESIGIYAGDDVIFPSYLVGYQMTLDSIDKAASLGAEQLMLPHYGLLPREKTEWFLKTARENAVDTAESIAAIVKRGGTVEDAVKFFREKYYHGNVKTIYPEDALEMNTHIMVNLIAKELCGVKK